MTEEWGPWIEHDGKGCPCVGALVRVHGVSPSGIEVFIDTVARNTGDWDWSKFGTLGRNAATGVPGWGGKVIRYRIRKPRALQTLIETAANPAPLPEEVAA